MLSITLEGMSINNPELIKRISWSELAQKDYVKYFEYLTKYLGEKMGEYSRGEVILRIIIETLETGIGGPRGFPYLVNQKIVQILKNQTNYFRFIFNSDECYYGNCYYPIDRVSEFEGIIKSYTNLKGIVISHHTFSQYHICLPIYANFFVKIFKSLNGLNLNSRKPLPVYLEHYQYDSKLQSQLPLLSKIQVFFNELWVKWCQQTGCRLFKRKDQDFEECQTKSIRFGYLLHTRLVESFAGFQPIWKIQPSNGSLYIALTDQFSKKIYQKHCVLTKRELKNKCRKMKMSKIISLEVRRMENKYLCQLTNYKFKQK